MTDSSGNLVERAVAGDGDGLSQLLAAHGPSVERTLQIGDVYRSMIDAADVMQVTYLEAFLRISAFDRARPDSFEPWLRQIAQNNLRDAIRGLERLKQPPPRNRVVAANHEDSLVGLFDLLGDGASATPSRNVRRGEMCSYLERAIESLPERYAQVIRLYDLEGRPMAEVAEAVGKSPGAIHMMRARAHDRLREEMGAASQFFSN